MESNFLNVGGDVVAVTKSGTKGIGGYSEAISVVVNLGVEYLYAKNQDKKNKELVQRLTELNIQETEKLKKLLENSYNEVAKTQVIIEFLNEKKIQDLEEETKKKRTISLIVLGVGVIALVLIFYKLNRQNG